jgi:hypothetical protein
MPPSAACVETVTTFLAYQRARALVEPVEPADEQAADGRRAGAHVTGALREIRTRLNAERT